MNEIEHSVAALLQRYQEALNASDTDAVMAMYAEDGVFMPQHSPSAVGAKAVRQAYDAVFRNIKLNVAFKVAEIVAISADWAFARTNSAGTVTVTGAGSQWKVATVLSVGDSGQGTLLIQNGGVVAVSGVGGLGAATGSSLITDPSGDGSFG